MAKQIIDRVNVSNTEYNVASSAYCTCDTAAATVAKVAYFQGDSTSATGFVPSTGVTVHVKFTYANTATNPTLSINGSTAAKIMKYGTTAVGKTVYTSWPAGAIVSLTYDGANWLLNDHKNETTATEVIAGNGLTATGTAGSVTLNVGAGSGIQVGTDGIAVDFTGSTGSAKTAARSDHSHYVIASPYSYLNLTNNEESSYIELNEDMISIYGSNGVELGAANGYASIDIGSCDINLAGVSRLGTGRPNIADTFDYGTSGQVLSVDNDGYVCWVDAPSCRYEYVAPDSSQSHLNYPLLCKGSLSTQEDACKPKFASEVTLNPYTGLLVATQVQATSFQATSDRRLKENIKPYSPVKSILDLPIVEFDYKKSKLHTIGCIAQDLQEICPEIVNEDAEGYLSINESKIVYLLLDEVKKLKAEVEALKQVK